MRFTWETVIWLKLILRLASRRHLLHKIHVWVTLTFFFLWIQPSSQSYLLMKYSTSCVCFSFCNLSLTLGCNYELGPTSTADLQVLSFTLHIHLKRSVIPAGISNCIFPLCKLLIFNSKYFVFIVYPLCRTAAWVSIFMHSCVGWDQENPKW
jgi:hypothetical protein